MSAADGSGGGGWGFVYSALTSVRSIRRHPRGPGPAAQVALRRVGVTRLPQGQYYTPPSITSPQGRTLTDTEARNIGRVLIGKKPIKNVQFYIDMAARLFNPISSADAATIRNPFPQPYQIALPGQTLPRTPPISTVPQPPRPPPPPDYGGTIKDYPDIPIPIGLPGIWKNVAAMLIAYAIAWGLPYLAKSAKETWEQWIDRWQRRQVQHEARVSGRRTPGGPGRKPTIRPAPSRPSADPGRGNPFPSTPAPQIIIVNVPAQPPQVSAPSPAVVPAATPTATPTPAPAPAPATKKPLWQQLLEQYGSAPFQQKGKRPIKVVNFMDSLTPSYSTGVDSAPMAFGDYAAWSPDSTGSDACTCPKKKRKKRAKRTVCYRGTYTETASGLTKRKRQKVPCK
jgi:hypothetical protein